jgi:hypothetical protein
MCVGSQIRFRFGLFIDRREEEEGMWPNSCAIVNRFWPWGGQLRRNISSGAEGVGNAGGVVANGVVANRRSCY